jgi:hypothetical protein
MPFIPPRKKQNLNQWVDFWESLGFCVLPKPRGEKAPVIPWKPYQERHPTPEEKKEFWVENYRGLGLPNIAVILGKVSGTLGGKDAALIVLDFDDPKAYLTAFPEGKPILKGGTLVVKTNRGLHLYLLTQDPQLNASPKDLAYSPDRKTLVVELLRQGYNITAPPSIHPTGIEYEIISDTTNGVHLWNITSKEITAMLERLHAAGYYVPSLQPPPPPQPGTPTKQAPTGVPKVPPCIIHALATPLTEGAGRNNLLFAMACALRARRNPAETIEQLLRDWNDHNTPPLTPTEFHTTLESAKKEGYKVPKCETLRQQPTLQAGCNPDTCFAKERSKYTQEELVEELAGTLATKITSITRCSTHPMRDSYYSLQMTDGPVVDFSPEEFLSNSRCFAVWYGFLTKDYDAAGKLNRLNITSWQKLLDGLLHLHTERNIQDSVENDLQQLASFINKFRVVGDDEPRPEVLKPTIWYHKPGGDEQKPGLFLLPSHILKDISQQHRLFLKQSQRRVFQAALDVGLVISSQLVRLSSNEVSWCWVLNPDCELLSLTPPSASPHI